MEAELEKITDVLTGRLRRNGLKGRTVTLKIKYHDFKLATRSHSFEAGTSDAEIIFQTAKGLLAGCDPDGKKIRLLGISLSNFEGMSRRPKSQPEDQLPLF
jgi:DNA polymerase-4